MKMAILILSLLAPAAVFAAEAAPAAGERQALRLQSASLPVLNAGALSLPLSAAAPKAGEPASAERYEAAASSSTAAGSLAAALPAAQPAAAAGNGPAAPKASAESAGQNPPAPAESTAAGAARPALASRGITIVF